MNLDIVIIDFLSIDGKFTNYRILPNQGRRVLVDRLPDVYRSRAQNDVNIGGTRIYNSSECSIDEYQTRIRDFALDAEKQTIKFQFEHKGIPIGPSRNAHGGLWNLILPPGWKLTQLYIVDPYDSSVEEIEQKKPFKYEVYWDTECDTQLIEMELRSGRGSFSFIVKGEASLFNIDGTEFISSSETSYGVEKINDNNLIDRNGSKLLSEKLNKVANWLELKPNFFGLGINVNQIIKDSIEEFKNKTRS